MEIASKRINWCNKYANVCRNSNLKYVTVGTEYVRECGEGGVGGVDIGMGGGEGAEDPPSRTLVGAGGSTTCGLRISTGYTLYWNNHFMFYHQHLQQNR